MHLTEYCKASAMTYAVRFIFTVFCVAGSWDCMSSNRAAGDKAPICMRASVGLSAALHATIQACMQSQRGALCTMPRTTGADTLQQQNTNVRGADSHPLASGGSARQQLLIGTWVASKAVLLRISAQRGVCSSQQGHDPLRLHAEL